MKTSQYQDVRSSKLLTTFGLLLLSMVVVSAPINRHLKDSRVETASRQAEVVGYQVAQIYREATKIDRGMGQNLSRNVASSEIIRGDNVRRIGTMGTDPWGQPYHYRILSADKNFVIKIIVWSSGPNMKVETLGLSNEDAIEPEVSSYLGDDMGVIVTVAQN